jgi:ribulose-phosphate 3-epimerase
MTDLPWIAPSLLSADFANLERDIRLVEKGGADLLHVDVMDGHFVPNLTIGPPVVAAIHQVARVPLDVHLMITDPERYAERFVEAGAAFLTFHAEAAPEVGALASRIRELGARPGCAVSPPTPLAAVAPWLDQLDLLVIMSVHPGFGGQSFMPEVLHKAREARRLAPPELLIQIDGGIGRTTIAAAAGAGVGVFVAGSAIFSAADPASEVQLLRELAYTGGGQERA